jgi:hypothetical protein
MSARRTPPRPPPALRVGVSGERLATLRAQGIDIGGLRTHVRAALGEIHRAAHAVAHECATVYSGPPILYLISPLADGAEQIAADEALRLGYTLHVPLACPAAVLTTCFDSSASVTADDPRTAFDHLLMQAKVVQVVDAGRTAAPDGACYTAVENTVLRHADLLIAVSSDDGAMDTGTSHGGGGGERAVPTVVIDPRLPGRWHVGAHTARTAALDVHDLIRAVLAPPAAESSSGGDDEPPAKAHDGSAAGDNADSAPVAPALRQYLDTRLPARVGGLYAIVVALLAGEWRSVRWVRTGRASLRRARADWRALWTRPTPVDQEIVRPLTQALEEFYVWAEALGHRYGTLHRDASTTPYLLGPVAVLSALLAHYLPIPPGVEQSHWAYGWAAGEAVILIVLLYLFRKSAGRHYHDRWLDYRSLAEQLRQLAFLWPLGRPVPPVQFDIETEGEKTQLAWVTWYVRAVARQAGLFPGELTPERLATLRQVLVDRFVRHQCAYHDRTSVRFERVYARLHAFTFAMFGLALGCAFGHLVAPEFLHDQLLEKTESALGFLSILLPALGTAAHGFASQGDFWNLAHRSRRTCHELNALAMQVAETPSSIEALGDAAEAAAAAMAEEIVYWRVFVRLRPPLLA